MTKELRGFINRVRRAQDKIFAGKTGENVSIEINMYENCIFVDAVRQEKESPYNVLQRESLAIHDGYNPDIEEIAKSFSRMSQIIGFDI